MYTFKRSSGFTLIELMITVAIIGILAGIAYPSYTSYVTQAKRGDGKAGLLKLQQAQEKYRANNTTYGTLAQLGAANSSPDGQYTLAVTTNTATSYTLTATPTFTDAQCNVLGIDQAGTRTVTGTSSVADCWNR
ncbi:type IV pilin protein [Candidatus Methylobacter oryzae]|uniref:Type IV pilin protein n=1 Tax=Candidatus Methylobacter oryzae TaxID=2497749 RepID=A0ABY3CGP4_9GAMM|nr:type IV pilin protein [Candidatus Methylobacter oryzae]TRX02946.1 type IV pilin protein [Candidatus Methylobacter oryzae]